MTTPKVPTATVKAAQLHTYHGHSYDVGDVYKVDATDLDTVIVQGKAVAHTPTTATAPPKPATVPPTK